MHANRLAGQVSKRLARHPHIGELLNAQPFRLIEIHHRNHTALLAEILRTNNLDLLGRTLPWTYHAYHNQGISYDYFQILFQAWKEVVHEHLPEVDARYLVELYAMLAEAHPQLVAAAETYRSERPRIPHGFQESYTELLDALLSGRHLSAIDLCHNLLAGGMPFSTLLQSLFYPAMVEVGDRWEAGEISVAKEHQATTMAYVVLSTLYYEQPFPTAMRGRAIVASVTNEFHELGAWMVTTCLELDGWEVTFLASNCSQETLIESTRRIEPRFVALSISLPSNIEPARKTVAALRAALPPDADTRILVGGRALLTAPSLVDSIGADLFLTDCETAVSWARNLGTQA